MKAKVKMLSSLLALILLFSLTGGAAMAERFIVPGGAAMSVAVSVERDEYTPASYLDAEGNEIALEPDTVLVDGAETKVCSVSYVDRYNQDRGYVDSVVTLLSQEIGVRIQPLNGYYVSDISLSSGDFTPSQKNLYSVAGAALGTATVTLFLSDIGAMDASGYTIEGDYLSSWGIGGDFTLNVTCRRIADDQVNTIAYDSGARRRDLRAFCVIDGCIDTGCAEIYSHKVDFLHSHLRS